MIILLNITMQSFFNQKFLIFLPRIIFPFDYFFYSSQKNFYRLREYNLNCPLSYQTTWKHHILTVLLNYTYGLYST